MRQDDARILDIIFAGREVAGYIAGLTFEKYQESSMIRAGVQWQVYTIGEAARQLSATFKEQHPSVPWHRIIGARNVLAHEYGKIDDSRMWGIALVSVPELVRYLEPLGPHEVEE